MKRFWYQHCFSRKAIMAAAVALQQNCFTSIRLLCTMGTGESRQSVNNGLFLIHQSFCFTCDDISPLNKASITLHLLIFAMRLASPRPQRKYAYSPQVQGRTVWRWKSSRCMWEEQLESILDIWQGSVTFSNNGNCVVFQPLKNYLTITVMNTFTWETVMFL